ncbi:response regulator transcription factor [Saccharibacillus sp. JS10]|uniref:response regulator transcription factor n=1 Tax=Saccharibacillus sp. JS10 TaxID=2950552 RepID=UPI002108744B|nr:response regulator transcription factor [Saccharibacillus sp. JS10]MCQ4087452.1 response regulator transcription factor [Saccharibacillus sp. JS10]
MTKKTVLYIEDERQIGEWVVRNLEERGYDVVWLESGDEASQAAEQCDAAVLDIMLPGLDGFTVGKRLKRDRPSMPVMMLSARTAIDDKIEALKFADDYLTKPFHPDELAARIEVMLRRSAPAQPEVRKVGHLLVYEQQNRIEDADSGEEIALTGKQFYIFMYFLRHIGQILTKEQIYEAVWGEPYIDGDKTLMVHIRYLREKIEQDPGNPTIVETIRGIGYRVRG